MYLDSQESFIAWTFLISPQHFNIEDFHLTITIFWLLSIYNDTELPTTNGTIRAEYEWNSVVHFVLFQNGLLTSYFRVGTLS